MEGALNSFLGIKCTSETDGVTFNFGIAKREATIRNISTTVAHIFDPCGWLPPITFWTKFLLQLLWKLKWDEPVSPNIVKNWDSFSLNYLNWEKINIPRWELCSTMHTENGKPSFSKIPAKYQIPARLFSKLRY